MIDKLKYLLLLCGVMFYSTQVSALSLSLDGTRTVISGTDCDIATYRFGLNETWNGSALDLIVEVVAEDNEFTPIAPLDCVGIEDGVFSVSLRDTDAGDNIAFVDTIFTVVQAGTTTPVLVDRITATGFNLDSANKSTDLGLQTGTDDVYLSGAGATYLAGITNVNYTQGSFPGGHGDHLKFAVGYNFTRFDDNLLNRDADVKGWFVNLVSKY